MSDEPQPLQFIDSNILVYAFDNSAGRKWEIARSVLQACWQNQTGCISIQVLQEFYVTVTRKIAHPLDLPTARQIVSDLSYWNVAIPNADDVLEAIDLQQEHQLSFWDAMILQSAIRCQCPSLLSEDLSHGHTYRRVRIFNPFLE